MYQKNKELKAISEKISEMDKTVDELNEKVKVQRVKTKKAAISSDLNALDEMLLLTETQAVEDLNAQQQKLPQLVEVKTITMKAAKLIKCSKYNNPCLIFCSAKMLLTEQIRKLHTKNGNYLLQ